MQVHIKIDGVEYQRVSEAGERLRIVVVDNRGLTFVGRCDLSGESEQITIRGARRIIKWGTTDELAELAASGPSADTVMGNPHDADVFRHNLVISYDVDPATKGMWRC